MTEIAAAGPAFKSITSIFCEYGLHAVLFSEPHTEFKQSPIELSTGLDDVTTHLGTVMPSGKRSHH